MTRKARWQSDQSDCAMFSSITTNLQGNMKQALPVFVLTVALIVVSVALLLVRWSIAPPRAAVFLTTSVERRSPGVGKGIPQRNSLGLRGSAGEFAYANAKADDGSGRHPSLRVWRG